MNNNVSGTIINMDATELEKLTAEVRETIATNDIASKNQKAFDVASLWNIQRGRKTQNISGRAVLSRRNTIV